MKFANLSNSTPSRSSSAQAIGYLATAPGKLILAGEHAVLHQMPALVQSINPMTTAYWEPLPTAKIEFHSELGSFDYSTESTEANQEKIAASPTWGWMVRLIELLDLPKVDCQGYQVIGWKITLKSSLKIGHGMGSSAAAIVSSLVALKRAFGLSLTLESAWQIAREAECCCHGSSSGIDLAASLWGGYLYFHNGVITPLEPLHLSNIYLYNSGEPLEKTSVCVQKSKAILKANPEWLGPLREDLESLIDALTKSSWPEQLLAVQKYQSWLERLGVVPKALIERMAHLKSRGVAFKISGAGALSGEGAGMLLIWAKPELVQELRREGMELTALGTASLGAWQASDSLPIQVGPIANSLGVR